MLKKWDLSVIFKDWSEWDSSFENVKTNVGKFEHFKEKLAARKAKSK